MDYNKPVELYRVLGDVIDSTRQTNAINGIVSEGVNYRYTSNNTLVAGAYISILDTDDTLHEYIQIIEADSVSFLIDTNYPIALSFKANAPYFMHEEIIKANERLSITDRILQENKYPLWVLTRPYTDDRTNRMIGYSSSFNLHLVVSTKQEYNDDARIDATFDPIIYPLYYNLLNALPDNRWVKEKDPDAISHNKTDLMLFDINENNTNPLPDWLDGTTISFNDLEILKNVKVCTPITPETFTLTLSSTAGGSAVSNVGGEGSSVVNGGKSMAAYPIPETNFAFNQWARNNVVVSDENDFYLFNINQNIALIAQFTDLGFPPNYSDVLVYYDGVIDYDNSLLIDKKNGLNATINNLDFTVLECISGLPFYSNSTVTFPASVPVIGNLTIPIQQLHQNFEFIDQAFSLHEDKVMNGEQQVIPSRVAKLAIYSNPQTGSNLTDALTYFNVPEEIVGAKFVDGVNGNDTTGDGTELLPYKTGTKALSIIGVSAGTIYMKSATYIERLLINGTIDIYGIGLTTIQSNGTQEPVYFNGSNNKSVNGLLIDATTLASGRPIRGANSLDICTVDKCKTIVDTYSFYTTQPNTGLYTIKNSSLNGNIVNSVCDMTIDNCISLFSASITDKKIILTGLRSTKTTSQPLITGISGIIDLDINNCIIPGLAFSGVGIGNPSMKYNTFNITDTNGSIKNTTGRYNLTISNNIYNVTAGSPILNKLTNQGDLIISDNTVTGLINNEFIHLENDELHTIIANNNIGGGFYSDNYNCTVTNSGYIGNITLFASVVNVGASLIKNNIVDVRTTDGMGIVVGGTTSTPNYLDGTITDGNKVYGPTILFPASSAHGIFYFRQQGEIKYNWVNRSSIGIVVKGEGESFANTTVHHNVLLDNREHMLVKGAKDVRWYNNTAVLTPDFELAVVYMFEVLENNDTAMGWTSTGNLFKNNILADYRTAGIGGVLISIFETSGYTGFESENNVLYTTNPARFISDVGVLISFIQWQAKGYDLLSRDSDPNLDSNLVPQPAIQGGENLGVNFEDILTSASVWPDNLVTEKQPSNWYKGAIKQ